MRKLLTLLFILFATFAFSQEYINEFMWLKPQPTGIKTLKKTGHKKILLQEFDKKGKCYFIKNGGLNGNVIAIWGIDYDDHGREIKTIFAHSNVGFSITETEYANGQIKQYTYTSDTVEISNNPDSTFAVADFKFNPFLFIKKINTKQELENFQNVIDVYKQKRYLEKITLLNDSSQPTKEVYFNHKGDTLSYSTYLYYNQLTIEATKHLKSSAFFELSYSQYNYFDLSKNLVKSDLIHYSQTGKPDTSSYIINTYNINNQLTSSINREENRTAYRNYFYENNRLVQETYKDKDRPDETRSFTYLFNEKGELIKETTLDKRRGKITIIATYKTTYKYW